jgi:hypothetical protein
MASFDLFPFLESSFPGLSLPLLGTRSLFDQWSPGLRFELSDGGRAGLAQACSRAATLYEALFKPQDAVVVIAAHHVFQDTTALTPPDRGPLFAISRASGFGLAATPQRFEERREAAGLTDASTLVVEWSLQRGSSFNHERIFEAIANADFARRPAITGDVYLLSPARTLLYWMYDDRGLDVIADESATLQPLYDAFGPWLLDYNRERMDSVFRIRP